MRNTITLFAAAMLAALAAAAPPIRPIEQPWDSSLPAATERGDSFLLTREVKVEVDAPILGKGAGRLFLLFDPSTGHYLQRIDWRKDYSSLPSFTDMYRSVHLGATSNAIWAFDFEGDIMTVMGGTQKADGLDDAESKALKFDSDHISELEHNRVKPFSDSFSIAIIRPLGKDVDTTRGGTEFVPETWVSLAWRNGLWEMTFNGYMRRDRNADFPKGRKHLKARFTLNSTTGERASFYTCVDDESQATTCP